MVNSNNASKSEEQILEWKSKGSEELDDAKSTASLSTVALLSPQSPKQPVIDNEEESKENEDAVSVDSDYDDCDRGLVVSF